MQGGAFGQGSMPCNRLHRRRQAHVFSVPLPTRVCMQYNRFVLFLVRILTLWVLFCPPIAHLAAKNRFSQRFVLMQKGGSLWMWWNVYLFKTTATNTRFWAICSKMRCVLVLNAVQSAAKRSAFWCKMQGVLVQNAVRFAAKCKVKWC